MAEEQNNRDDKWPDDDLPDDEWRLGGEPIDRPRETAAGADAAAEINLSHRRMTRPVYVMTVEHLSWIVLALYAVMTRTIALGAAPLGSSQAIEANLEYGIARGGLLAMRTHPGASFTWPEIVQSWILASFGADDATARFLVALCALMLIATAYAMRPYLGRAGALGFGAMLALSPSVTYFSRTGSTAIASLAFMMSAIAIAASMHRRPGVIRAAGLGCAIALWLSADPIGYATAATVVISLAIIGAFDAVTTDHLWLRIRVWWERRRTIVLTTAIVALGVWYWLATGLFSHPLLNAVAQDLRLAFAPGGVAFERGIRLMSPILGFYEFMLLVLAIAGAIAILARWARNRFAVWSLVWAVLSISLILSIGAAKPETVVAIVVPCAILSGFGIEWMHHSTRWNSIRIPLAILAALTLYVQMLTGFVYSAPDTSEAPWNRHALLFWSTPATSLQTPRELRRGAQSVNGEKASAVVPADAPQVAWYLRDLALTDIPEAANIVVSAGSIRSGAAAGDANQNRFGFEESWTPDFKKLTVLAAIRYFLTQRPWSDVLIRDLQVTVKHPSGPLAPTVILTPEPSTSEPTRSVASPQATPSTSSNAAPTPVAP